VEAVYRLKEICLDSDVEECKDQLNNNRYENIDWYAWAIIIFNIPSVIMFCIGKWYKT